MRKARIVHAHQAVTSIRTVNVLTQFLGMRHYHCMPHLYISPLLACFKTNNMNITTARMYIYRRINCTLTCDGLTPACVDTGGAVIPPTAPAPLLVVASSAVVGGCVIVAAFLTAIVMVSLVRARRRSRGERYIAYAKHVSVSALDCVTSNFLSFYHRKTTT